MRNIRQNSNLKAAVPEDNKPLPPGLIPAFYKLKETQKLYQVRIHFAKIHIQMRFNLIIYDFVHTFSNLIIFQFISNEVPVTRFFAPLPLAC